MKLVNTKGAVIFAGVLIIFQLAVGLVISPRFGNVVIDAVNKHTKAKVDIDRINIWPLTLSCSIQGIRVFDPDNENERIALVPKAVMKISPLRLLAKQVVFSKIEIRDAEILVKGEPDGSFNVQKLVGAKKEEKALDALGLFDRFKGKKDWVSRVYDMVKKNFGKEAIAKRKAEREEAKKTKKEIQPLPTGRRVKFKTPSDAYVFQIKDFTIKDSRINLDPGDGSAVNVEKAVVSIRNLGIDPARGARFDGLKIKGKLDKGGDPAGTLNLEYSSGFKGDDHRATFIISAEDINLAAVSFIYKDSLPVDFKEGYFTARSSTEIVNNNIDSRNSVSLKDHDVSPAERGVMVGLVPLSTVCEALNQVDPASFKFDITGTVESPEFSGFMESLMALIKPYLSNVVKNIKEEGVKALGDIFGGSKGEVASQGISSGGETASKALDSIKSIFSGEKK